MRRHLASRDAARLPYDEFIDAYQGWHNRPSEYATQRPGQWLCNWFGITDPHVYHETNAANAVDRFILRYVA